VNYFDLHIGDYDKATAHLTACEDGIYGRLLRRYYDTEAPLPNDLKAIQRLVRARARDERAAVQTVLDEFFELTDDGWRHKRCDDEIARYQEKRNKAKRSADARWGNKQNSCDGNANASADAMRTHSDGNATVMPPVRGTNSPDARHQTPDARSNNQLSGDDDANTPNGARGAAVAVTGFSPGDPEVFRLEREDGIPIDFTLEVLAEFKAFYADKSPQTPATWHSRFLQRVHEQWARKPTLRSVP